MRTPPVYLSLLSLLLLLPLGCGGEEPMTEVEVDAGGESSVEIEAWIPEGNEWVGDWNTLVEEVRRDLAAVTGSSQHELRFLVSDSERVADVLDRNVRSRFPADEQDEVPTATIEVLSKALLGIYDLEKDVVHIALDHFEQLGDAIDMPELPSREVVYAVMVHEGAHAYADAKYDLARLFREAHLEGAQAVSGAEAVCEGYAQYLARKACKAANREQGFLSFTRAITELPDDLDAGQRAIAEMSVRAFGFAYGHGENFVTEVIAEGGPAMEAQIFAYPPTTRTEVLRPEWYLDPDSRPAYEFELDEALALVPAAFDEVRGIKFTRSELGGSDIAEANATALGAELAQEMGSLVEVSEVQLGLVGNGDRMAMVNLIILPDEESAGRFLELIQAASDAKDEAFRESGTVEVLSSESTPIAEQLGVGVDQVKRVKIMGQEVPVRSLLVSRGRLLVEVTLSNLELGDGEAEDLADRVLRKAMLED